MSMYEYTVQTGMEILAVTGREGKDGGMTGEGKMEGKKGAVMMRMRRLL